MQQYIYILALILFSSCSTHNQEHSILKVDLDYANDTINYSTFVDSVSYIELNTNNTCLLSDINKIYLDNDTFLIWDSKKGGILSFNQKGKFIKQINYYGNGPEEFVAIKAFCIDPIKNYICVWDYPSERINKYTYSGIFVESEKNNNFVRDFAIFEDGSKLCILPFYSQSLPYGIWTSDSKNDIIKKYDIKIPKDHLVEFSGTYCNQSRDDVYYYDRNWDQMYKLTKDTCELLYSFKIQQVVDEESRKKDPSTLTNLNEVAYMTNFSISNSHILQSYFYGKEKSHKWVMYNKKNNTITVSKKIYNDLDNIQTDYPHIHYLNDSTWCRIIETDANNCNILLQIIHLNS